MAHFFEELSIEAEPTPVTDTEPTKESYFTSLGEMHGEEPIVMTNLLADNAFKHRITTEDNTTTCIIGMTNALRSRLGVNPQLLTSKKIEVEKYIVAFCCDNLIDRVITDAS